MRRSVFWLAATFASGSVFFNSASAQGVACSVLSDPSVRLGCYDNLKAVIADTQRADVIDSLKKLSVDVDVGISYREYPRLLADTVFLVEKFQNSEYAKNTQIFHVL